MADGLPDLPTKLADPGVLCDGEIALVVSAITPGDPVRGFAPAIHFKMHQKGRAEEIGQVALRVGWSANLLLYGGHIGYTVEPGYRGNRYAEKAVRLLLPVAWANQLPEVVITCNPDNIPSIRTCERLGAKFEGNVPLPPTTDMAKRGELSKNRYVIRRPALK